MRKFFIVFAIVFIICACQACTSLHMVLDGLEHAELEVTHHSEEA